ncbi:MAG: PLP-dependent transferase [Deinococcales bacterium]
MSNTEALAQWLSEQPGVVGVHHPALKSSPYFERAKALYPHGAGSILTFELAGGREAGKSFLNSVKLSSRLVNLGDAKTSVTHPASTTHSQLDEVGLKAAGVSPGTVRVSVGIEHIEDIKEDFAQALASARV